MQLRVCSSTQSRMSRRCSKKVNAMLLYKWLVLSVCSFVATTPTPIVEDFAFTLPFYNGFVQERALSRVVASDVMMGMWLTEATQGVRFRILDENDNGHFRANQSVVGNFVFLIIRSTSLTQSRDIRVQATSSDQTRTTFCTVHVAVIDVNDFQPLFPSPFYSVTIPEDTRIGSKIASVQATDSDKNRENTRLYYSLSTEFPSDYFAVHPTRGDVTLTAQLNAETQSVHSVLIQVTDRKAALAGTAQPKSTTLTVIVRTVNAHAPKITLHNPAPYSRESMRQSGRSLYALLRVFDEDSGQNGQVGIPEIVHCDVPGLLAIEPRGNGGEYDVWYTEAPPRSRTTINATIEAFDLGEPPKRSRIMINISAQEKRSSTPFFLDTPFNFTISEISPVHSYVGFVKARLLSSNRIRYFISRGNEHGYFAINEDTSLLTTNKRLTRVVHKQFTLTVVAENLNAPKRNSRKSTSVSISLLDANNHDPMFTESNYRVSITESASVGSHVISVLAIDEDQGLNGSVVYHLINARGLPFAIGTFNGSIFITEELDSDHMSEASYVLRVRAGDNGWPFSRKSECVVVVDIENANDNAPEFNQVDCSVSLPISTPIRAEIIQFEPIDIDLNPFTCSMQAGNDRLFAVDPTTCIVRLLSKSFAVGDHFRLLITASDDRHTSIPSEVAVEVVAGGKISKRCRDTGAIRRYEEAVRRNSQRIHFSANRLTISNNCTADLPNRHRPVVIPRKVLRQISVHEDTKVGSEVYRIRAIDRDRGYNGKLWFTIDSGNEDSAFFIDSQSGVISTLTTFDRERKSSYSIKVKVTDLGTRPKTTLCRIPFKITDVNDNPPNFIRDTYSFEISEDAPVGFRLKTAIKAVDKDEGANAKVKYTLSPSPHYDHFHINPVSGVISVSKPLDREKMPTYNLIVVASDSSPLRALSATTSVSIRLQDVNDNSPQFHRPLHRIRISEDLPVHAVIFWLRARDPDAGLNGKVRYTLTEGASNIGDRASARFQVDDRTGVIRLSAPLDAFVQSSYNITARARDLKELYSTCYIEVEVVSVNRNLRAPYFPFRHARFEISESAPIGTEIGSVIATDDDITYPENDIRYSVRDGTGLGVFTINPVSGTISNMRDLDCESQRFYWLTVVAEDQGPIPLSGRAFILVEVTDVNDNAPETDLPFYNFSLSENNSPHKFVGQLHANDRDIGNSGNITYSMKHNDYFAIDARTGEIWTKRSLDREQVEANQLSFDVTSSDSGSPVLYSTVRVQVCLTDVNDNAPQFSELLKKKISLPKKNRFRTAQRITRVYAWDSDIGENAAVVYSMNSSRNFQINPKTGVISQTGMSGVSHKTVLKIAATDGGANRLISKFRLEIVWNSFPPRSRRAPVFAEEDEDEIALYFEHVDTRFIPEENSSERIIRMLRATDADSELLWFNIIAGNDDHMFDINGDHILYVAGSPDAEMKSFYNLTIQVSDGYNRALKQVPVRIGDVNDNPPMFSSSIVTATIRENSPPGSHVIRLQTTDGDVTETNRNFIFRIRGAVDPASIAKFRITAAGDILTTVALNREVQREHVLTVEVDDQGVPGPLQDFCRIRILVSDANEFPPEFTTPLYYGSVLLNEADYSIGPDDESDDAAILRVDARDRDCGENARVVYSISSGNKDRMWKIDATSGEITLSKQFQKLRSIAKDQVVNFTVTATDGAREPLSSTTRVQIRIVNSRNAIPRFEAKQRNVTLLESLSAGSFVAQLKAQGPFSATYNITSGNEARKFSINPHSGVITLNDRLDRERVQSYQLTVSAISAEEKSSETHVIVQVDDVNDNRPKFLSPFYTGYVSAANAYSPSFFILDQQGLPLQVEATDPDKDANGYLVYELADEQGSEAQRFAIDSYTGVISSKPGNFKYNQKYTFKVRARDLGSPRLSSENFAIITVRVTEDKSAFLNFTKPRYNVSVYLPVVEGMLVSRAPRATVIGRLQGRSAPITYSLIDSNANSVFKIDPRSGDLLVNNPSLLLPDSQYQLRMRATNGKLFSLAEAEVTTFNFPQSSNFRCSRTTYESRTAENSTKVRRLVAVSIDDSQMDDHNRYAILNPHVGFGIGFTSGVVHTIGVPLDRETKSVYALLVEVTDVSDFAFDTRPKRARCLVRIALDDVNDNAPSFLSRSQRAFVRRNAGPGALVKQMRAVDLDTGGNGRLVYSIEGGRSDLFVIDSLTGDVTLRRAPRFTASNESVSVLVEDMGNPPLRDRATLHVYFVNGTNPVFNQTSYAEILVNEDTLPYSVISNDIKAFTVAEESLYYTIEDGDPLQQFDIDYLEGTLRTLRKLDREQSDVYELRVRATAAQSKDYADVEIVVIVEDANDNWPKFSKPYYRSVLPESAVVGSLVTKVAATDADIGQNGEVTYSILNELDKRWNNFFIDPISGALWTGEKLDFERRRSFLLRVRASDFGVPARHADVMVTLTVDDTEYQFEVEKNAEADSFVGKVAAWDLDKSDGTGIRYSLQELNSSDVLKIDSNTGVLTLKSNSHSTLSNISTAFTVTASDGLYFTSAVVRLSVRPGQIRAGSITFERLLYSFKLVENQAAGTRVGKVAAEGSEELSYAMAADTLDSDLFRVDRQSGAVFSAQKLDRQSIARRLGGDRPIIAFQIAAVNAKGARATCDVLVEILDLNDNAPTFDLGRYVALLTPSDVNSDDVILKITARDPDSGENGRVSYSWAEDSALVKGFLHLERSSGRVSVVGNPSDIDFSSPTRFFVEARDYGAESQSNVVPVFLHYVPDPTSIPRFSQQSYFASVASNEPIGYEVVTVQATVMDNMTSIRYSLGEPYVTGKPSSTRGESDGNLLPFSIDTDTGVISTNRSLDLDHRRFYHVPVLAYRESNRQLVVYAQVVVNITYDYDLRFPTNNYRFSVPESAPVGTTLAVVGVLDGDRRYGDILYRFKEANSDVTSPFSVDKYSGRISVSVSLDREAREKYEFVLVAIDRRVRGEGLERRKTTCHVIVHVIDVNDSPPLFSKRKFQISLSESVPIGYLTPEVISVKDDDEDGSANLRVEIIGGDSHVTFRLVERRTPENAASLRIGFEVIKELDRETTPSYNLTLLATDGRFNSTTSVRISTEDVNDNPPVCHQLIYYGSVVESVPPHSFVVRVRATDADDGENGRITYSLSGDGSQHFRLDRNTGKLFASSILDREEFNEHRLLATATDKDGYSCTSQIYVTVEDANDHAPSIDVTSLRASVYEDIPINSVIHRLVGHDADAGENGSFVFSLAYDGPFYVEPNTGVVLTKMTLDRERVSNYEIPVQVADRGIEPLSSTALLHIQILDVNDNPPIFDKAQYDVVVKEDAAIGHVIARVTARSLDVGANAILRYSIARGNEHGKFAIHPDTGEVSLVDQLDYEQVHSYVIKISASDSSENPLATECTMFVDVTDVNDNSPQFTSALYEASVTEDVASGRTFLTVKAFDRDAGSAGNITYRLARANSLFEINSISGKLSIGSTGLDYEKKKFHSLSIVASDQGQPALSGRTTVEVTVIDVNDNRPRVVARAPTGGRADQLLCSSSGANCTIYVNEKARSTVSRGLVQLNATDADGEANSGPFTFRIKKGNKAGLFYLDSKNILKSKKVLKLIDEDTSGLERFTRRRKLVHRLRIEARDSGSPLPLASQPYFQLQIVVLKRGQHPPKLTPHRIQIVLPPDVQDFTGKLIAERLNATDRDLVDRDRLRFSLASPNDFEEFLIQPLTGALTSTAHLSPGSYKVSIRVSDASQETISNISIDVVRLSQEALESSVSISFRGIASANSYLDIYHSHFLSKLKSIMPVGFNKERDFSFLSLQAKSDLIELLFCIRKPPNSPKSRENFYSSQSLRNILESNRILIEESLRLSIASFEGTDCSRDQCRRGTCKQLPKLSARPAEFPVTTDRYSLVSSSFRRSKKCECPLGTTGASCESICSESHNPCAKGQTCKRDDSEEQGYRCHRSDRPSNTVSFAGHSVLVYAIGKRTQKAPFTASMRLRTFQPNSTVFHATGPGHLAKLESRNGFLLYTFDCGGGLQKMAQNLKRIDDGFWHDVAVEAINEQSRSSPCGYRLTVNGNYTATAEAPNGQNKLELTKIALGAELPEVRAKRGARKRTRGGSSGLVIRKGFVGCIEKSQLNGHDLSRLPKHGIELQYDVGTSSKCRIARSCPSSDHCSNGGTCLVDIDGSAQCSCASEWTGSRCEKDVDECAIPLARERCGGKANCFNFEGGYACNCSSKRDRSPLCEFATATANQKPPLKADGSLLLMIIGAISGVIVFVIVVIATVICWRKRTKNQGGRYRSGSRPSQDITPVGNYAPGRLLSNQRSLQQADQHHHSTDNQTHPIPIQLENQGHREPPIGLVYPQVARASFSIGIPSESSSYYKPSSLFQEYERSMMNGSASSSMRHCSPSRRSSSTTDHPSYHWNIVDCAQPDSVFRTPSVPYHRDPGGLRRGSGGPSSPESHLSLASSSATHRSQRSDALTGHYNVGKRRRQKQLLQMIALKEKNEQENLHIQRMLTHLVSQELHDDVQDGGASQNSSMRGSLSRYQQPLVGGDSHSSPNAASYYARRENPVPSSSGVVGRHQTVPSSSGLCNELGSSSETGRDSESSSRPPKLELPPPPSEHELKTLNEEDADMDAASSSLLPHPSEHDLSSSLLLQRHEDLKTSDVNIHHDVIPNGSSRNLKLSPANLSPRRVSPHFDGAPPPPERMDSEHLPASSLSDDAETGQFLRNQKDLKNGGRKAKTKRSKKRTSRSKR